jgi:hypothetical protein
VEKQVDEIPKGYLFFIFVEVFRYQRALTTVY